LHAEHGADEVLEAEPVLVERVVGNADDDRERRVAEPRPRGPAQIRAVLVAA
jgi:hypothetical protein